MLPKSVIHQVLKIKFMNARVLNFGTRKAYFCNSRYIISGPPLDPIVGLTIPEYLFSDLSKHENSNAFSNAITNQAYTFKQIYEMSHSFAAALKQHGIKNGDVVGILLPNVPEYPVVELGSWLAGAIVSPISYSSTSEEIVRQCNIAEAKTIVTTGTFLPLLNGIKSQIPTTKSIINIDGATDGALPFFEMAQVNYRGIQFSKGSSIDTKKEVALLSFSSGTSGPPKAVMLTHSNICSNVEQYRDPSNFIGQGEERFIAVLPFYHCYGAGVLIYTPIKRGSHVSCVPKFDPLSFVAILRAHKPTTLHIVPPLLQFMCQSPDIGKSELESVHTIICGAAAAGRSLIKAIIKKSEKDIFFQEGYGMTEMTAISHLNRAKRRNNKLGSIGEVFPGTKCKVVDSETGTALPSNTIGELCVKGPQVMKVWVKNEAATKETIDSDGWLKTGDVVLYDEDKCFFIVGRSKELIKVKGLQVSPSELEDLLRTSHDILDVAVIGVPHERFGEAPRAYIVRKSEKLTVARVHDFLERKIADHKKLSGGVEFVEKIPRSLAGKILRRVIIESYKPKPE